MDESGTHDGSPVVSVAAYAARPETWQLFTEEWNLRKGAIRVFHAVDCQNLRGEFEGWTEKQAASLVVQLLHIILSHNIISVVIGINLNDYEAALQANEDLRPFFGSPYTACFQWVVTMILH